VWNLENRFTGWGDVNLTEAGISEAIAAGAVMAAEGLDFDMCFASVLTRSIKSLNLALEAMGRLWLPVVKDWRLNARHYGALTGLNKHAAANRYGAEQVRIWRRSFDVAPPPLEPGGAFELTADRRYAGVEIPATESLKDAAARVRSCGHARIAPELKAGKRVLVSAHSNSLRVMVKHLSSLSEAETAELEISTGQPIVYDLDDNLAPRGRYSLLAL